MDENNQNPMQPMEPMNPVQPAQDNTQGQFQQYQAPQPEQGQYQQYQAPQPEQAQAQYQQYQAPQQQYQQPQYQAPSQGGNGFGVGALVLGIVALVLCWVPWVSFVCIVIALILGIMAIVKKRGTGMGIAGIILSVIAAIPAILIFVTVNMFVGAVSDAINDYTSFSNSSNSSSIFNSLLDGAGDALNSLSNSLNTAGDALNTIGNEIENRIENATNTTNTTNTTSSTSAVESKLSTLTSPASIGEWTTASSYKDGNYIDTPFKINKIARGEDAKALITASGKTMTSELLEGCEWIVIDYSVDTTDFKVYANGTKSLIGLSLAIRGLDGEILKYQNKPYILTGSNLLNTSSIKTEIYNGQYVFQLPIGCTDYLIKADSARGTAAYIKGE